MTLNDFWSALGAFAQGMLPWVTPFVAVTALAVTFHFSKHQRNIAAQQKDAAVNKLKLDLFDRRLEIFRAIEHLIGEVQIQSEELSFTTHSEFRHKIGAARWLFDADFEHYVQEISAHARAFIYAKRKGWMLVQETGSKVFSDAQNTEWLRHEADAETEVDWFLNQDSILIEKAAPFLELRH